MNNMKGLSWLFKKTTKYGKKNKGEKQWNNKK